MPRRNTVGTECKFRGNMKPDHDKMKHAFKAVQRFPRTYGTDCQLGGRNECGSAASMRSCVLATCALLSSYANECDSGFREGPTPALNMGHYMKTRDVWDYDSENLINQKCYTTSGRKALGAIVAVGECTGITYVAFRGESMGRLLSDYFNMSRAYLKNVGTVSTSGEYIRVHAHLVDTYEKAIIEPYGDILQMIGDVLDYEFGTKDHVVLTGHGMGGAMALYALYRFRRDTQQDDITAEAVTFGASVVGNEHFATEMETEVMTCFLNEHDGVAKMFAMNKERTKSNDVGAVAGVVDEKDGHSITITKKAIDMARETPGAHRMMKRIDPTILEGYTQQDMKRFELLECNRLTFPNCLFSNDFRRGDRLQVLDYYVRTVPFAECIDIFRHQTSTQYLGYQVESALESSPVGILAWKQIAYIIEALSGTSTVATVGTLALQQVTQNLGGAAIDDLFVGVKDVHNFGIHLLPVYILNHDMNLYYRGVVNGLNALASGDCRSCRSRTREGAGRFRSSPAHTSIEIG